MSLAQKKQDATRMDLRVRKLYLNVTKKDLATPSKLLQLLPPDNLSELVPDFNCMGRKVIGDIVDFILNDPYPIKVYSTGIDTTKLFVTGTPGSGKTCSVAAASGFIHHLFATENRAAAGGERRKLAYVNTALFLKNPVYSLWCAFMLAFISDREALKALDQMQPNEEQLVSFLKELYKQAGGKKLVYIVFNGHSKLDEGTGSSLDYACKLIELLAPVCLVVICCSMGSTLLKGIPSRCLLVCRNYTKYELQQYVRLCTELLPEVGPADKVIQRCRIVAGYVPRMVFSCVFEPKELQKCLEGYKAAIYNIVHGNNWNQVQKLEKATRNEPVDLFVAGVFYCDKLGRGKCLTNELKAYTLALMAKRAKAEDYQVTVDSWINSIHGDSNAPRIGWKAIQATILTLCLLQPSLRLNNGIMHIHPQSVKTFQGSYPVEIVEKDPTLFVPEKFNHIGASVFYADENSVVMVLISIANNAANHHPKAEQIAEEIFEGDARKKAVVWIVYTTAGWEVRPCDVYQGATRIVMSFAQLDRMLDIIDLTIRELRNKSHEGLVCSLCSETVSAVNPVINLQCDLCGSIVHKNCSGFSGSKSWICEPCRFADEDSTDDFVPKACIRRRKRILQEVESSNLIENAKPESIHQESLETIDPVETLKTVSAHSVNPSPLVNLTSDKELSNDDQTNSIQPDAGEAGTGKPESIQLEIQKAEETQVKTWANVLTDQNDVQTSS